MTFSAVNLAAIRSTVFVALGSNLDYPVLHVEHALRDIDELPETALLKVSTLYETLPVGLKDQSAFVNAVAQLVPGSPSNVGDGLVEPDHPAAVRRRSLVGQADRQRFDGEAIDEQSRLTEDTHVGEEDAVRRIGAEVARSPAEAEGLSVDQRDQSGRITEAGRFAGQYPRARLHWSRIHGVILP